MLIYVDLDGVTADLECAILTKYGSDANIGKIVDTDPEIFDNLPLIPGAKDGIIALMSQGHEIYFLSTAPWENPRAWASKRQWVEKHFGIHAYKRLILTHRKDLVIGDYLIDDRTANGAGKFKGIHIHFGKAPFENWEKIIDYLLTQPVNQ